MPAAAKRRRRCSLFHSALRAPALRLTRKLNSKLRCLLLTSVGFERTHTLAQALHCQPLASTLSHFTPGLQYNVSPRSSGHYLRDDSSRRPLQLVSTPLNNRQLEVYRALRLRKLSTIDHATRGNPRYAVFITAMRNAVR